jgi:hypothetical protein
VQGEHQYEQAREPERAQKEPRKGEKRSVKIESWAEE